MVSLFLLGNKFLKEMVAMYAHVRQQVMLIAHQTHVDVHLREGISFTANEFQLVMDVTTAHVSKLVKFHVQTCHVYGEGELDRSV